MTTMIKSAITCVLLSAILMACTFDIIIPNQNDAQVQDAGVDSQQDASNVNADLLQLTDLTQIYYNCERFSTPDAGPKHLGYSATYNASVAKGAFPVYMCSAYMDSSCNVESLFVNEQSYYRSTPPTIFVGLAASLVNVLSPHCNLSFIYEGSGGVISAIPGSVSDSSLSPEMVQYITQCSVDGGSVYMALMEFYNSEFSAFMSKDTSAFTFTCTN